MAHTETEQSDPMGPAIIRGIIVGIPVSLVALTLGIWAVTGLEFFEAFATALLPGVLLGAFGGGFAGMAITMKE